ncbi:MAG: amino acid ABC transporter permease [Alphaproteobacteria bacterium]|nr:amino acid ABC transporter permease [Alphaproteobacteria bacterium]MBV9554020.1 amino acid ABC transporter permease [Alphaproteobacteria bacterium]
MAQDIPVVRQAPPPRSTRALGWLRVHLFSSVFNSILTLLAVGLLAAAVPPLVRWALIDAIWSAPNGQACHAGGACWAFIGEKMRFILFGRYPADQEWRPIAVVAIFIAMIAAACVRPLWGRRLAVVWFAGLSAAFLLMAGGLPGLRPVETGLWSGLPLTLILAVIAMLFGFPLGVLLALGRRSRLPAVRGICVGYIELVRGVPLITVLFMASLMLPLFLPAGVTIDKVLRAQVAFILFAAAYLAEVVRGGLQAIPKGQIEAADALGLSYLQRTRLIVLPQALAMVIPPLVNTFIGMFKDTSLVLIVSLFDLLGATEFALTDSNWQGFAVEADVFIAAIYWSFCFFMSRYSQLLEREFNRGKQR